MPREYRIIPGAPAWPMVLLCAALTGCTSGTAHTGRSILEALERDAIPIPRESGDLEGEDSRVQLPESGPITLADLLAVAEAHSPELAGARSEVGIAAGRAWQAALYPNPRVELATEDISLSGGAAGAKTTLGVTQPIVLGGRLRAAEEAADAERAARLAGVVSVRWEHFGRIAEEHARLLALSEQLMLYEELRALAGRTLAAAQTRFDARAAPEIDVIRPRVELHLIDAAIFRLAQERTRASRQLSLLVGGAAVDASRLSGAVPMTPTGLDLERLDAGIRSGHPALLAADLEIDGASARLARVRAERTPDLDLRVAAGYRGENDDGVLELGAGMEIPFWDGRRGEALSARFEVVRVRQRREALELDLRHRVAEVAGEYEVARVQLDTFRDSVVPDARRAFEQTGESYRAGRASFLDLLDAQRTLADARITQVELAGRVAIARAKLTGVVGPDGLVTGVPASTATPPQDSPPPTQRPDGAEESQ